MAHPARFSDELMPIFQQIVDNYQEQQHPYYLPLVLDPFAGTGRIHELQRCSTWGVEIEPEWANMHSRTQVGDATDLPPYWVETFDMVITSPCVTPDMRILTADLRWVPAGDIKVGDRLFAFNENAPGQKVNGHALRRRYEWSEVIWSEPSRKRCVRVILEDDTVVTTTFDHPWLAHPSVGYDRQEWIEAQNLRPGTQVLRAVKPWVEHNSWDAGWIAGMFDGEGSLTFGEHGSPKMQLCQVAGPTNDAISRRLIDLGHSINQIPRRPIEGRQQVVNTYINGGIPGLLTALGSIRPERLLSKFMNGDAAQSTIQPERVAVVAVEEMGEVEIAGIQTTSGTYICEGYLHHNTYGNRMADHHDAKDDSKRITYRHKLGRPLHERNTGQMQWGGEYMLMHRLAWIEVWRVLTPGGWFVLNIRDHIRDGKRVPVCDWHVLTAKSIGFELRNEQEVKTRGMRFGANRDLRLDHEMVYTFIKPNPNKDNT